MTVEKFYNLKKDMIGLIFFIVFNRIEQNKNHMKIKKKLILFTSKDEKYEFFLGSSFTISQSVKLKMDPKTSFFFSKNWNENPSTHVPVNRNIYWFLSGPICESDMSSKISIFATHDWTHENYGQEQKISKHFPSTINR